MTPKRIAVKFFARSPEVAVDLEPFIPLFHRFIQESTVEGLLLDVANYIHVPNGPGVVLIGHDVDYGIDSTSGRVGLLTLRKRAGDLSLADLLADTLRRALTAVQEIEADGSGKIDFALDQLSIEIVDRIVAPNTEAGYEDAKNEVEPVLAALFGNAKVEIAHAERDARAVLSLEVSASEVADVATLLTRLPARPEAEPAATAGSFASPAHADGVAGPAVPGQTEWDVSVEQLRHLRKQGSDFTLVDVREQQEVDICEIGGKLIPLGSLEQRMSELDASAFIVVHCHVGGRSANATRLLRANGFVNAWNLQGGIRAWIQRIDASLKDY